MPLTTCPILQMQCQENLITKDLIVAEDPLAAMTPGVLARATALIKRVVQSIISKAQSESDEEMA